MRPTSRLDLLLVPRDLHAPPERALQLLDALIEAGIVDAAGAPGPRAEGWIAGAFTRLHVDDPGRIGFWANRQGGFGVRCPVVDAPVVEAFARAMGAWRAAGDGLPPTLPCPACGRDHRADELRFLPEAAFGRWALVTGQVAGAALAEEGEALVRRWVGPCGVVLRRG